MAWSRGCAGIGVVLAVALAAGTAHAGDAELARARDAYDRGVKAESRGDHGGAARAFAEADALAPSVASLEAALESTMRADDAPLGAELLERAEARVTDAGLAKTLDAARKRFSGRTGKVRVDCGFAKTCLVAVDGQAKDATRAVHVAVGAHSVVVERDGVRLDRLVEVRAGEIVVLAPEDKGSSGAEGPPPDRSSAVREPPPAREPAPRRGLPPALFFVGLGATAVAGGFLAWSATDSASKHDAFVRDGCSPAGTGALPADCAPRADGGRSADTRTNVLLATTGGLAVLTGVVAFLVEWRRGEPSRASFAPMIAKGGGGGALSVRLP